MEKKNMILLTVIAGATFLVAMVGATFAFFTATVQDNRNESDDTGKTSITAGSVANTIVVGSVSGTAGQFTATDVYPGHMEVAALSVKADNSQNEQQTKTNIAIKYDVTQNDFADNEIKVSIYKKEDSAVPGIAKAEDASGNNNYFQCEHKSAPATQEDFTGVESVDEGVTKFYEECANANGLTYASAILLESKNIAHVDGASKSYEFEDVITADGQGSKTVNYYVVVEFVDTKTAANSVDAQNASMNAVLKGDISVIPA